MRAARKRIVLACTTAAVDAHVLCGLEAIDPTLLFIRALVHSAANPSVYPLISLRWDVAFKANRLTKSEAQPPAVEIGPIFWRWPNH